MQQTWSSEIYERNARFVSDLGADVLELLAPRPGERILDLGCGDGALTDRLAATGADHPFFSRQKGVSKRTINKLIKHDHNTLEMVRKAVNASNDMEKVHAEANGGATVEAVRKCHQLVSSCRGHFSERNGVLRGI